MSENQSRLRIGIIFGGRSGEHDVSLNSARSVMNALDPQKYEIIPIGITRQGQWIGGNAVGALQAGQPATSATLLVGAERSDLLMIETGNQLRSLASLDLIFPVLHGTFGEDGTVQGFLELANLPYVGAGVVGSSVGMDKGIFKSVMTAHGLPIVPWQLVSEDDWRRDGEAVIGRLERELRYPMFTKPANLGSSVGISKCHDRAELQQGLAEALRYDRRIVVEQGVQARELEVAVLGNDDPQASVVGEIRPKRAFYDYEAKYITDDSDLIIPAELPEALAQKVRDLAIAVFKAIDCAGLGRVDFLLDTESAELYINEINTLPGFTNISMYPKLWEASGLPYPALLDRLVELAFERYEQRERRYFGS